MHTISIYIYICVESSADIIQDTILPLPLRQHSCDIVLRLDGTIPKPLKLYAMHNNFQSNYLLLGGFAMSHHQ